MWFRWCLVAFPNSYLVPDISSDASSFTISAFDCFLKALCSYRISYYIIGTFLWQDNCLKSLCRWYVNGIIIFSTYLRSRSYEWEHLRKKGGQQEGEGRGSQLTPVPISYFFLSTRPQINWEQQLLPLKIFFYNPKYVLYFCIPWEKEYKESGQLLWNENRFQT